MIKTKIYNTISSLTTSSASSPKASTLSALNSLAVPELKLPGLNPLLPPPPPWRSHFVVREKKTLEIYLDCNHHRILRQGSVAGSYQGCSQSCLPLLTINNQKLIMKFYHHFSLTWDERLIVAGVVAGASTASKR